MSTATVWWLLGEALAFMLLSIYLQRVAYRHGVWDGAFNHFLPVVRREMVYYDEHRARAIFASEVAALMPLDERVIGDAS